MKSCLRFWVFIFLLCDFLSVSCLQAEDREAITGGQVFKETAEKRIAPAPDFELQDIYQDNYTLRAYRNKQAVFLFFWTTWCPFCQKELTILNNMYAGLAKDGIEVLSIDVGERPEKVMNFVKNYYLSYRVLLDTDTDVSQSYEVVGVPTYILVDKQGYIIFRNNYFPLKEYKDLIAE